MSAQGMRAQSERIKIISQNIANADVTALTPGGEPYRRKILYLGHEKIPRTRDKIVKVLRIKNDPSQLNKKYDPSHPAADAQGYVLISNVNKAVEMMEARQANHSYEANLNMLGFVRDIRKAAVGILAN